MENIFIIMTQEIGPSSIQDKGGAYHFFDQEDIVHHEYASQGQTVNQHFHLEVLRNLHYAVLP